MFRRSYSPKAYISNVLYSEDSFVRKFLFRKFDIPKVLQGYLCSESPIVWWMMRLCNVRWPYGRTVRLTWFKCNGKVFSPAMCNNSFCRVKFPNCLKHSRFIQMSIDSFIDEWCIYMTRGRVMRCQRGQDPMFIALRSRAIVIELFWHLGTRANISVLSSVNCFFVHGIIIFYFRELYFMHWIWCLATLKYEVCNNLFVLWTKVHNVFYIFPECLELIGVRWPTDWRVTLKFHNGLN